MNELFNKKTLRINGNDPRRSRAFLALSEVMNTPDRLPSGEKDWQALEKTYQQHLRHYGFDLQSGCWFCLINLQQHGWQGLAQALSLLVWAWSEPDGRSCWPAGDEMRVLLLEWFNSHVVTRIYTLESEVAGGELKLIAQDIAQLQAQAEKANARCRHALRNIHYFLQIRGQRPAAEAAPAVQPEQPAVKEDASKPRRRRDALVWSLAGAASGVAITLLTVTLMHKPVKGLQDNALAQRPALIWPNNEASQRWRQLLQERAASLPSTAGYGRVLARLDELDAQLLAAEQRKGSYLTISELKSISWTLRRELESAGPLPEQLLQQAGSLAQLQQIAERLDALTAFYLLRQQQILAQENGASPS